MRVVWIQSGDIRILGRGPTFFLNRALLRLNPALVANESVSTDTWQVLQPYVNSFGVCCFTCEFLKSETRCTLVPCFYYYSLAAIQCGNCTDVCSCSSAVWLLSTCCLCHSTSTPWILQPARIIQLTADCHTFSEMRPCVGREHPVPPCPFTPSFFALFCFSLFLFSFALPIFFFCPSLPFLPE